MKWRTLFTAGALALAFSGAAWFRAQQRGGADEISARAAKDLATQQAWASQPGGTPEDSLWQVLVLFGVDAKAPADYSGTLRITGGEVHALSGYRFELPDRILPEGGWRVQTRAERVLVSSPLEGPKDSPVTQAVLPKGLLVQGAGRDTTQVIIETAAGRCEFAPMRMGFDAPQACAGGRLEVRRIPPATDLSGTLQRQHDFPSIAAGPGDTLWAVWSSFHDGREELNLRRWQSGRWTRLIPVGRAQADLWRPQVAVDAAGKPWLVWAQQEGGNWDIFAMPWLDNEWGARVRLSAGSGPHIEPHVARAPDGAIYVVWQWMGPRVSQIRMAYLKAGKWSAPVAITSGPFDDWLPAVAAGSDGRVWISWDRYRDSYDVYATWWTPAARGPEMSVAASGLLEAYSSIAVDRHNRPWVAYETGGANWGKDLGAALKKSPGTPLGAPRTVEIAVLDEGAWKSPAPLRFSDAAQMGSTSDSDPLLYADPGGTIWLAYKRRYSRMAFRPSTYWETWLTRLEGERWTPPVVLPYSWTRKSTRLSLAANAGRLWAFWPSESRDYAFASRPHANRVYAGSLPLAGAPPEPRLSVRAAGEAAAPPGQERADVAAIRAYRTMVEGRAMRIVRGDLHRHTELSQDVGGLDDGSLPEFYRYMLDAAAMDFGASTDHQGGGTDYWNFLTQKMAGMYHARGRFTSLYAYERNLGNPFGHRNIIHTQRNYPVVPFFQRIDPRFQLPDSPDGELLTFNSMSFGSGVRNDTELLYEELRKTGGMAIPHTSGTDSMGTDWAHPSDPAIDAVLEIYQGARQNYEHKNAPRGIRDGEEKAALGGFQEAGLVWNAWKKGYRIGVIASSDHYSTHISYAMVYTPANSRAEIFAALKKRHTYGATDNIILDVRLGDRFMGDDFTAPAPLPLRVKARGTAPVAAVHVIRDAAYVYKAAPGKRDVDFEFRDTSAGPGQHWYYVRIEQADGELAWSSPIWVKYTGR